MSNYSVHQHHHLQAKMWTAIATYVTLQDKKDRLYIISALSDTPVDLKVLSARLGLGKGGLRFAPDELLGPVLGINPGSVTPLAVSAKSASQVLVLLDDKIQKTSSVVYVHPMVNTASLPMTASNLESYLASVGRQAVWVDLEANPKIDKDNPPDLKHHAESITPSSTPEEKSSSGGTEPSKSTIDDSALKKATKKKSNADNMSTVTSSPPSVKGVGRGPLNVDETRDRMLHIILEHLGISWEDCNREAISNLAIDLDVELNSLRNAAYTTGFKNARSSIGYLL